MIELSKSQKKIARELINLGLQRECQSFKNEIEEFTSSLEWKDGNPQELYHKLADKVVRFDKHIGKRYNDLTGSRYFIAILDLLHSKILTTEDIAQFDMEVQNEIMRVREFWDQ